MSFADLAGTIARIDAVVAGTVCARRGCWTPTIRAVSPWCSPTCARTSARDHEERLAVLLGLIRADQMPDHALDAVRFAAAGYAAFATRRPLQADPEPTARIPYRERNGRRWAGCAAKPILGERPTGAWVDELTPRRPWWRRALAAARRLPW